MPAPVACHDAWVAGAACAVCGKAMHRHERAAGTACNSLACRTTLAVRERDRRRQARQADLDAAAKHLSGDETVKGAVVGAVPCYGPVLTTPDPARIALFVASLRRAARAAVSARRDVEPSPDAADPPAADDETVLRTACGVCGGRCCQPGGTHAFLTADEFAAKLASLRPRSSRALVDLYIAWLPERSYEGSCVYHAEGGCALPRPARSAICNAYRCNALVDLATALEAGPSQRVVIAAVEAREVRRAVLMSRDPLAP